jgi:hypothetical protein
MVINLWTFISLEENKLAVKNIWDTPSEQLLQEYMHGSLK